MGLGGVWAFFTFVNMGRMGEEEKRFALIMLVYFLGNLMMGRGGEEQRIDYAAHAGNILEEKVVRGIKKKRKMRCII